MTATVVLAVGAEATPDPVPGILAAAPGRPLAEAVREAASAHPGAAVVVVPMTFGRDPSLVANCARTLRDVRGTLGSARVCLAAPFGDAGQLVAYLRAAVRRDAPAGAPGEGAHDAVLVTAPSIDPFADAELFRVARLVRQYGRPSLVEVAFAGGAEPDPDLAGGLERCRRLGAERPLVIQAVVGAPLLSGPAVRAVVDRRVHQATHQLGHGDDGVDAALGAEDGHGYAHSHVAADGSVYTHSH